MLYNNNSNAAIYACERARTGNYGEDSYYEEDLMDDYDGEDEWKESILSHNEAGE